MEFLGLQLGAAKVGFSDEFAAARGCCLKIVEGDAVLAAARFNHEKLAWFCRLMLLMPDHLHAILAFPREPGVKRVVQLTEAVAVVADSYWRAQKAVAALKPTYDDAGHGDVTSDSIFAATNLPPTTTTNLAAAAPSTSDPPEKFDALVRADFFQGVAGDREAFSRAMKLCEETLAAYPKHAQAMVWHGSGLLFLSAQASAATDSEKGPEFWQRGMKEMDAAIALEPDNLGVLLPHGATLLAVSRHTPNVEHGKALLKIAVADYEKVLRLEKPDLKNLSPQARCDLLFGLADGWHRLANTNRARLYFQRVIEECEVSPLANKPKSGWRTPTSIDCQTPPPPPPASPATGSEVDLPECSELESPARISSLPYFRRAGTATPYPRRKGRAWLSQPAAPGPSYDPRQVFASALLSRWRHVNSFR